MIVRSWKICKVEIEDLENFKAFLSFNSVSSDTKYDDEVELCANWLSGYLKKFCAEVHVMQTDYQPVVIGKVGEGEPVVIYGDYDVQPADLADGWNQDPFEPSVVDGRVYARGAQDNKGQLWYCIQAVKNLVQSSNLSRRVIFFIEGEEESAGIGSRRLLQLEGRKMFEDSKVVLIPDAGAISDTCECITVGLRGSASFTVSTKGPDSDLHSGIFGGLIPNPIFDAGKIII